MNLRTHEQRHLNMATWDIRLNYQYLLQRDPTNPLLNYISMLRLETAGPENFESGLNALRLYADALDEESRRITHPM